MYVTCVCLCLDLENFFFILDGNTNGDSVKNEYVLSPSSDKRASKLYVCSREIGRVHHSYTVDKNVEVAGRYIFVCSIHTRGNYIGIHSFASVFYRNDSPEL